MSGIKMAYDVGRNEFDVTGFQSYFRKFQIAYDDFVSGLYKIPIEAGKIILGVGMIITEAFDGTPTLDVGYGSYEDAFVDSTTTPNINAAAANAFYYSQGGVNAGAQGVYFGAAGILAVKLTATDPTQGKLTLLVHELDITDSWRAAGLGV